LTAIFATIQVPWPKYIILPSTVRGDDRGIFLPVFQGLRLSLSNSPRPRRANQRKADFGDFGMRIDLELLGLQAFFHGKAGKPENVQAFVTNEEVLAGFQQISRPYSAFARKFPRRRFRP
jgi:hypothetical protein